MSDPLAFVSPGDPIPHRADTFNELFKAARLQRARGNGMIGALNQKYDSGVPVLEIDVKNNSGGTLLPWGVLKLNGPFDAPATSPYESQAHPTFLGITPTASTDIIAIAREGAASGSFVRCVVSGVCLCKVNVTNSSHGYASPQASAVQLLSGATGSFPILWKESGTGSKMAYVLLNQGVPSSSGGSGTDFSTGSMTATIDATCFGAGTGGFVTSGFTTGSKYRGAVVVFTGSSPLGGYPVVKVTLSPAFTNSPLHAQISPIPNNYVFSTSLGSVPLNGDKCCAYPSASTSYFYIYAPAPLSAGTYYSWTYQIVNT